MPNYDYSCESCGYELEAFQKITDDPLKDCPKCQKVSLKRGIGGGSATLRFVGSGFYITDYKDSETAKTCQLNSGCCPCKKEP